MRRDVRYVSDMHLSIPWLVSTFAGIVLSHSWIDSLTDVSDASNVGYIRAYQGHLDTVSSFLIQNKNSNTMICRANQLSPSYTAKFPMLSIRANGAFIATYTENGHVTKDSLQPDNKPHPGTYTWFLARSGSDVTPLRTYGDLMTKATVIATGNFDDGKCAEDSTRGRSPRPCQSFVQLTNVLPGMYQLVWLWEFPKVPNVVEMYSSCADIRVVAADTTMTALRTSTIRRSTTVQAPDTSTQSILTDSVAMFTTAAPALTEPALIETTTTPPIERFTPIERFITLTTTKTIKDIPEWTSSPDGSLANL